jgi:HK97 family phage major capsid protein
MSDEPKAEASDPPPEPVPAPDPEPRPPETNDADVTTQPAILEEEAVTPEPTVVDNDDPQIKVRDAAKRELDIRIIPWDTPAISRSESFARGAFDVPDPSKVLLMGLEHEVHFGLGENGPRFTRHPVGRGMSYDDQPDGAYMTFKVASTQRGDEVLALASEGIVNRASIEFSEVPGGKVIETRNGRRHTLYRRAALMGVSTTYRPDYGEQAAVLAVRSRNEGDGQVTETQEVPVNGADNAAILAAFAKVEERAKAQEKLLEKFMERSEARDEQIEARHRQDIEIPNGQPVENKPKISQGDWLKYVVRMMTGDRITKEEARTLDDIITQDNLGVVPTAFLTELIGVIDASRPFLGSTRRLPTPSTGMKMTVPVINQRPTAGVQSAEKVEVDSQKTLIGTTDFDAITIAGAGDLSLQIIKRSSPDFLNLWMELLAEAYAIESEDQAILALLNATGGVGAAVALNPASTAFGAAYVASFDAIRRPPDTIWLSTEAVGEFIDAKATTTNQPLYPGLAASATAAGGITGVISGLRPVHVPSLDAHGAYAIVGPSSGFAWAEDGTYTLQVDVPATAGRDVALVGLLWPCPWYPAAFTTYNVAS